MEFVDRDILEDSLQQGSARQPGVAFACARHEDYSKEPGRVVVHYLLCECFPARAAQNPQQQNKLH